MPSLLCMHVSLCDVWTEGNQEKTSMFIDSWSSRVVSIFLLYCVCTPGRRAAVRSSLAWNNRPAVWASRWRVTTAAPTGTSPPLAPRVLLLKRKHPRHPPWMTLNEVICCLRSSKVAFISVWQRENSRDTQRYRLWSLLTAFGLLCVCVCLRRADGRGAGHGPTEQRRQLLGLQQLLVLQQRGQLQQRLGRRARASADLSPGQSQHANHQHRHRKQQPPSGEWRRTHEHARWVARNCDRRYY